MHMPAGNAVLEVTDATFGAEVIVASKSMPVVVDFWAPWCGPCRVLGPVIERVAADHRGSVRLVKLNTDENPRTAAQFRIQGIPAVKAIRDGRVVAEFTGVLPESQVRAFFKRIVPSEAEVAAREAQKTAMSGDAEAAEAQFRKVLAQSPGNTDAIVGLAQVLIQRGDREEAEDLLERAPADRRAKVLKHRLFLDGFAERHGSEDLRGAVAANPSDPRAQYRWGVMLAAGAQYEEALEALLESVRLDRRFADGAARKAALAVFDILGLDSPLTRDYQRRLGNLLF
jgi:putative thioredoxin